MHKKTLCHNVWLCISSQPDAQCVWPDSWRSGSWLPAARPMHRGRPRSACPPRTACLPLTSPLSGGSALASRRREVRHGAVTLFSKDCHYSACGVPVEGLAGWGAGARAYMEDKHTVVSSFKPLGASGVVEDGVERSYFAVFDGPRAARPLLLSRDCFASSWSLQCLPCELCTKAMETGSEAAAS